MLSRTAIVLFCILPLSAADDPAQLLARVAQTYRDLKTYHFVMEQNTALTAESQASWTKSRFTLAEQAPGRFRYEASDPMGYYAAVSDGQTTWTVNGDLHEFIRKPASKPPSTPPRLRAMKEIYWKLTERLKKAEFLSEERIAFDGQMIQYAVIRAEYDRPPGQELPMSIVRTFWIDPGRNLIVKEESVTTGNLFPSRPFASAESRRTFRFTHISIGETLPESLFTYTPPPEFREVESLETPFQHSVTASRAMVGSPAPDVAGVTLSGEPLALSSLRGKVVLLDFWATWCGPCRAQMPALAALKKDGLVLLGVNDDSAVEDAVSYLREHSYDWPSLFDGKTHSIAEAFKIRGIPTLVLIDRAGRIVEYQVGAGAETDNAIRAALRGLGIDAP